MSQLINGTKLSNGNFMIELTNDQMNDLAFFYLMESSKWYDKAVEINTERCETSRSLARQYMNSYREIRDLMQG
jgi:hypothetical protein